MPWLSIITINLNNRNGLQKTIESVRSQTFKDFELIGIDGGSSDGSVDFIQENSSLFTYWHSKKDSGIYNAMNLGIQKSKGKYCIFLNSGDALYEKDTLLKVHQSQIEADIVYGDILLSGNGKSVLRKFPKDLTYHFLFYDMICHQSIFFKTQLFLNYGYYDESYLITSDYEFLLRAILKHQSSVSYIDEIICDHDTTGISLNSKSGEIVGQERDKAQKLYFKKIERDSAFESFRLNEENKQMKNSFGMKTIEMIKKIPCVLFFYRTANKFLVKMR